MLKAYKYRIYPTDEQKVLLAKTFGCCRFVYNWALNKRKEAWEKEKKSLGLYDQMGQLSNELKKEHEWLCEPSLEALRSAIRNVNAAYKNFFRDPKTVGYPRYKSRFDKQSFQCLTVQCRVDFDKNTVSIPKIKDIPAVLHRTFEGKVKAITIEMTQSGKYFASVMFDTCTQAPPKPAVDTDTTIGIDMGIKSLAVLSDGREIENPKNLRRSLKHLKMLQRRLSRKKKGSNNRNKARIKVARMQEKIANKRKDYLNNVTHALTHDDQVHTICIEDLNVSGMTRNHHLAQAVIDASFGEFRRQLEYKCDWYGVNLVKIDRFAPSSKMCSKCGYVYKGLKLSERSWTCPECGTHHDRDFNAAVNIKEFGLKEKLD